MKVTCPSCQTSYNLDGKKIPPSGAKLKCAKCHSTFQVADSQGGGSAVALPPPLPKSAPPPSASQRVPLPPAKPITNPKAAAVPLPRGAPSSTAGAGAPSAGLRTGTVIPLPVGRKAPQVHRPNDNLGGLDLDDSWLGEADGSVPLPGAKPPSTAAPPPAPTRADGTSELDFGSVGFWEGAPEAPMPMEPMAADDSPAWAKSELPDLFQVGTSDVAPAVDVPSPTSSDRVLSSTENALPRDVPSEPAAEDVTFDFSSLPQAPAEPSATSETDQAAEQSFFENTPAAAPENLETLSFDDDGEPAKPAREKAHSPVPGEAHERVPDEPTKDSAADYDRLKKLYEGRMALVSVVHTESTGAKIKKHLPLLVAGGAALLFVIAGMSLGLTRYGVFGLKKILMPTLSESSPEFAKLQEAKHLLLADTLQSYSNARDRCAEILKLKEYPEVRAVWLQSVFYLERRYSASNGQELSQANERLQSIDLLGPKHPEVVKAQAGSALAVSRPDPAVSTLQDSAAREKNAGDLELQLLFAEALAAKGQTKLAADVVNRVIAKDPTCAKAIHFLGNLYQAMKQPEKAELTYQRALAAAPTHLSSAVELAGLQMAKKDLAAAEKTIGLALVKGSDRILGANELAKAFALNGVVLLGQNKSREATEQLQQALKIDPNLSYAKGHLATLLLAGRDYEKSISLYKDIVGREPANVDLWDGYLGALIGARKLDQALGVVKDANSRFPSNARIAYQFGRIVDASGDRTEAEKHYKHSISSDPKMLDSRLSLSRLYLRSQKLVDAKAQVEQATALAPDEARVHALSGELAVAENDPTKAKSEFQKAVAADAKLPEAYLGLSRLAYLEGAFEQALKFIDQALAVDPLLPDGSMQRGLALWKLGKPELAIEDLKKAKDQEPKSSKITVAMAAVLIDKGDFGAAESSAYEAVTQDPYAPEGHFYLALARNRRGEHYAAIESMKNALERAPNNPIYHYQMGLIDRDAKNIAEAIEEWKRAVQLDSEYADPLEALGRTYMDRADFDSAIASLDKAFKTDPSRLQVRLLMGDCFFQSNKWDAALKHYQAALKADPVPKGLYFKLGRTYTEKGKHASAIEWYRKAIEADKTQADAYYYLGYALKERHLRKDAIGAFKEYLALSPEAKDKKEIEDEIYDLGHD